MNYEFPLVFFTVLSQLGAGLALFLCWRMWIKPEDDGSKPWREAWLWTGGVSVCGLIASLCHLGHPFAAYRALGNLGSSSLSWEALGFACFTALAFLAYFWHTRGVAMCAALAAAFSLVTQGLTYAPPSMPAINNAFPMAIFWLSAIALGGSGAALLMAREFSLAARLASLALIVALLAGPALWTSGSATMRETAAMWLGSGWFWTGMALMALALVATWFDKGGKLFRFVSLACGIFFTRMAFFADTAHTAANMGLPFN